MELFIFFCYLRVNYLVFFIFGDFEKIGILFRVFIWWEKQVGGQNKLKYNRFCFIDGYWIVLKKKIFKVLRFLSGYSYLNMFFRK